MTEEKGPDYTLNVFHDTAEQSKDPCVSFVVQTTKIFVSFRYDILMEADVSDRTVTLTIKGLHAPELLMPGSGPAYGAAQLQDLFGHYTLNVVKQDKTVNTFDIDVGAEDITILRSPKETFITLSTDAVTPS